LTAGGGSGPPGPGGREFSSLATREPLRTWARQQRNETALTLLTLVLAGLVLVLGGVGDDDGCLSLQLSLLALSSSSGEEGRVSGSRLLITLLSLSSYVL
ncbi:unnamed protein product, partial [Ixodes hexagonus]